jgi:glutathione S-transferase
LEIGGPPIPLDALFNRYLACSYSEITGALPKNAGWSRISTSDNEFICGPHFTIADITGMVTVDFCGWAKLRAPEHLTHLRRWHSAVSARPSAKA